MEEEKTIPTGYQEAIKELSEKLAETSKQFIDASKMGRSAMAPLSEAMRPILEHQDEMFTGIRNAILVFQKSLPKIDINFPKIEIPEDIKRLAKNVKYLKFLQEVQWPLFLERNQFLQSDLSMFYSDYGKYDFNGIRDVIFEYYSDDAIRAISKSWEQLLQDDSERLEILLQAITLHLEETYYASTALLMSQVNGIITKADNYMNEAGYEIDENEIKAICEYYEVTYNTWKGHVNTSERSQMLKMMAVTENGFYYWDAVTKYIRDIVLKSHGEDEVAAHNPMRNKILHGVQLNYGTKEHSLKAILSVDLLIQYYAEINAIITSNSKEE